MKNQQEKLAALAAEIKELIYSDASKTLVIAKEVLALAQNVNSRKDIASAYNQIAICYFNLRDLKRALNYIIKARDKYIQLKMPENVIGCLTSQGAISKQMGNYASALKLYFKAIEICEQANITQPVIYNNIGTLYYNQKKYADALVFFHKALNQYKLLENPDDAAVIINLVNIGNAHIELFQHEEAKEYYSQASELGVYNEKPMLYIPALKGLGKIAQYEKKFEIAKNYFIDGLKLSEETGFYIEMIKISLLLSDLLIDPKEQKKRLSLLKNSLETAVHHQNDLIEDCLEKLISFYEEVEDFEQAYATLKKLSSVKTKKYEKEKIKKIEELQAQFESKEKDLQIAKQQQEKTTLELQGLRAQLNPHFMFNSLQSIQQFILKEKPLVASDYLARFAKLMRLILNSSNNPVSSLVQEQKILENYLALEQLRFNAAFQYELCFDKQLNKNTDTIPTFLLQPFVENAVIHGVSGIDNGHISIHFRKMKQTIFVHIIDNGVGKKNTNQTRKKHPSKALSIIKERIKLIKQFNGKSINFKLLNRLSGGTHVALRISN